MFGAKKFSILPVFPVALLLAMGCNLLRPPDLVEEKTGPDITPTRLDYVDSDAFDALLQTALINQDPVILIRTGHDKPDWTGRLNAWIAAWNRSERSSRKRPGWRADRDPDGEPTARGQFPDFSPLNLDGQSIRELRLLVGDLLDRIEDRAQAGAAWWQEERARSHRVALLKPYSLRFHMDQRDNIQLIFFHGNYSSYYPRFMQILMNGDPKPEEASWSRSLECSCLRKGTAPFQTANNSRDLGE